MFEHYLKCERKMYVPIIYTNLKNIASVPRAYLSHDHKYDLIRANSSSMS